MGSNAKRRCWSESWQGEDNSYHSLLKRGIIGTFHHVSEKHLGRYLAEFGGSTASMGTDNAAIWAQVEQVKVLLEIRGVLGQMDVNLGDISNHTL